MSLKRTYISVTVELWPVVHSPIEDPLEIVKERLRQAVAGVNLHQVMINSYKGDFRLVRSEDH